MKPIRVAYVVHTFHTGGLERCVARLLNGLTRPHFQPAVVCLNESGAAAEWVRVDDVPIVELHKRRGNDLGVVWSLARALRRLKIDVAHSHNWGTLLETCIARRWARVRRYVHAERGTVLAGARDRTWRFRVRRVLARWALRRTDRILAVAESTKAKLSTSCSLDPDRIQVIPNGVDRPDCPAPDEARERIRQRLMIPTTATVFGSLGRLEAVKDFALAIRALDKAVKSGSDVHLVLVGDGSERDGLQALATCAGLNHRVHLVGLQSDVGDWLAAFDVYVNSSRSEGMSQAILEAMSVGLPSLVTDVGDSGRLVADEVAPCGVVVPPADPGPMSDAMQAFAAHAELRINMGRNAALRFASDYSVERMVRAYEELYSRLIGRHPLPVGDGGTVLDGGSR